jgi:hypothetical protein
MVRSIIVRNVEDGDISNLRNIALYDAEGKAISKSASVNGKDITFVLDYELTPNKGGNVYIKADVTTVEKRDGDSYQFQLRNAEDINAQEVSTKFRTTLSATTITTIATTSGLVLGGVYKVEGSDVVLTRASDFVSTLNAAPGATNVVFAKGTITTKEAITVENYKLKLANTGGMTTGTDFNDVFNRVSLRIGGSTLNGTVSTTSGGVWVIFDGAVTVNRTADIELLADFRAPQNPKIGEYKFADIARNAPEASFGSIEYVSNGNKVNRPVGILQTARVSLVNSKLNFARTDGLSSRNIVQGANDEILFGGRFSSSDKDEIKITSLVLQDNNVSTPFKDNVTATLYVNGEARGTVTQRDNNITFSSLNIGVKNGTNADIQVKANFSAAITTNSTVTYSVTGIQAIDYNGQPVNVSPINAAPITISSGGEAKPSVSSTTPNAQLLFAGEKDKVLATFSIDAINDNLRLTDLYVISTPASNFNLSNGLSNIRLRQGGNDLALGNPNSTGGVSFENITEHNTISAGRSLTFSIVADINNALNTGDIPVSMLELQINTGAANTTAGTYSGMRLISNSNGAIVEAKELLSPISKQHKVVRTAITVAKTTDAVTQSDLGAFTVTPNGYKANLTGLTVTISTNLTGTATVELYKGLKTGQPVATGSISGTGLVSFTSFNEEVSSITTFYLVLRGATVPASTTPSTETTLVNVEYGDVFQNGTLAVTGANSYENTGLPQTWNYQR